MFGKLLVAGRGGIARGDVLCVPEATAMESDVVTPGTARWQPSPPKKESQSARVTPSSSWSEQ